MSEIVIQCAGLSKRYKIGEREPYLALRDVIARTVSAPTRIFRVHRPKASNGEATHIWALKDVSFDIRRGEVVGIIGRNGAGKSTLLKILARVTKPTRGHAEIHGRMGTLLEVGTGFHPELTGRENTYLNGAILGMSRREVERKFDEIVAFAEIEKFIDTPIKHYSSGMYLRLAFAVAAHLETEILIVDEVLAVGDALFQKKCLGKMGSLASQGRTVIFVSHNVGAVQQLTARCFLLHEGRVVACGDSASVIARYQQLAMDGVNTILDVSSAPRAFPELSRTVEFLMLEIEDYATGLIPAEADITLKIRVRANDSAERFLFGLTVFRLDGTPVGSSWGSAFHSMEKGQVLCFGLTLHEPHLAPGLYNFALGISKCQDLDNSEDLDVVLDVLPFEVLPPLDERGVRARWARSWGSVRFKELTSTRLGQPVKGQKQATAGAICPRREPDAEETAKDRLIILPSKW
jgi:lipopolysaccharide transport system ATP-binding protein